MVEPIKLYKKVIIVLHAALVVSTYMYISLPGLPLCIQSSFKLYLRTLAEIGTDIMINLNKGADMIIRLVKWGHRETTIYDYDPCTDSLLKRRILHERMNTLTNWENVITEYNLAMCCRAVEIIGQETQKNTKNIEANGTEDNSFNLLNIHFSSAGIGIGVLIVLVFVYKIVKESNLRNWSALCQCIFPCARKRNPTPIGAHHSVGGSVQFT